MAYSENATNYSQSTLTDLAGAFDNAAKELNAQIEAFNNALTEVSSVWDGEAKAEFEGAMGKAITILQKGKDTFDKWKTAVDTMKDAYEKAENACKASATK